MSAFFPINSWGCTAKKGFTFHPDVIKEGFAWQFLSHDLKQFKVVDYQSNPGKPFFYKVLAPAISQPRRGKPGKTCFSFGFGSKDSAAQTWKTWKEMSQWTLMEVTKRSKRGLLERIRYCVLLTGCHDEYCIRLGLN